MQGTETPTGVLATTTQLAGEEEHHYTPSYGLIKWGGFIIFLMTLYVVLAACFQKWPFSKTEEKKPSPPETAKDGEFIKSV